MSKPLRVLAGDYNLTPTQRPAVYSPESTSAFNRVPIHYTFPASGTTSTIDYIHILKPQLNSTSLAGKVCDDGYSDHCYIYGRYN